MSVSSHSRNYSPQSYEAVSPVDIVRGHNFDTMALPSQQTPAPESGSSSDVSSSSVKTPRTARFAEATSVHSPVGPSEPARSPFADPPHTQHDVSDIGFGYVSANDPALHSSRPPATPLKSALKTPGTPGRALNPLSPTFREEFLLDKQEQVTEKENARDMRVKTRVRIAKVFLRFVNFGCSLIVLSLLATTLTIFNTTRSIPSRNNLPAWATGTNPWAQYLLLGLSCFSLFTCMIVFWGYYRGGHRRAQKTAVYYTVFSVCFFVFSLVMWVVGAAIYANEKATGNGQDLWGWSCKQNTRSAIFSSEINYALLCRLQDWGLMCAIIEVVIELFVILIYVVVFYRFWSKRKLTKSMDLRDKARSDLYLAQLRIQSAPNTPGFPKTPKSPYVATSVIEQDIYSAAENGELCATQYAIPRSPTRPRATFQLQAPPIRIQHATPRPPQEGFTAMVPPTPSSPPPTQTKNISEHMGAAPGERTYDAVPIPGAYTSPMTSPSFPPPTRP